MAYSKTATSVIQGMSLQADKYMVDGQCRYQKNMIPSPSEGVCKRPSTEQIAVLDFLDVNEDYKFFNVEVNGLNYQFILSTTRLYIVQEFTLQETIDLDADLQSYIGTDIEAIKLFYINDKVYILNTEVVVQVQEEDAITHATSGSIWSVGVSNNKNYTATIKVYQLSDDAEVYTTSHTLLVDDIVNTKTSYIIDGLFGGLSGSTYLDIGKENEVIACRLKEDIEAEHYITIVTNDDASNTYLKSFTQEVNSSQNLPRLAFNGQRATVSVAEGNIDDWYLVFEAEELAAEPVGEDVRIQGSDTLTGSLHWTSTYIDTETSTVFAFDPLWWSNNTTRTEVKQIQTELYDLTWEVVPNNPALEGQPVQIDDNVSAGPAATTYIKATRKERLIEPVKGTWNETAKSGSNNFNTQSLPIVLDLKDTWQVEQEAWLPRRVGDEESAPFPEFVGKTINSLYEHAGRIVVITDDFIDLGAVAEPFNWFRYTATDTLITDPFPVSYGNKKGKLRYPVTLNGELYIFGDRDQLKLTGQPLSPTNYSLTGVSSYPTENIEPIVTGNMIHFISKSDRYNSVYSFAALNNVANNITAESISDQISRYITGNVVDFISDYNLQSMLLRTDQSNTKLHLYNFYFIEGALRQSAWSDLEFNFDIVDTFVADSVYYMVGKYNNTLNVYKFDIKDLVRDDNIYLDNKQEVTFINGTAQVDTINQELNLYDWVDRPGTQLPYTDNGDGTITCDALLDKPSYLCQYGVPYEAVYIPRLITENNKDGTINHTAKFFLTSLGVDLGASGQFNVKIDGNGAQYDNNYNLAPMPKVNIGYPNLHNYNQELSVRALSDNNLTIKISAENAEALCIEGMYYLYNRAQRRTAM